MLAMMAELNLAVKLADNSRLQSRKQRHGML
jgi:hypothetical protein